VCTREDLVEFIGALARDYEIGRSTWANAELGSFLGAMAAWSADMEGFYTQSGEQLELMSPWRVLAEILVAARVYE
jgi:hypothetical protein